jgi:hypothetical protein
MRKVDQDISRRNAAHRNRRRYPPDECVELESSFIEGVIRTLKTSVTPQETGPVVLPGVAGFGVAGMSAAVPVIAAASIPYRGPSIDKMVNYLERDYPPTVVASDETERGWFSRFRTWLGGIFFGSPSHA